MTNVKIHYALKEGKFVSILDIPEEERGLKCNCFCPLCNEKLSAKLGTKKEHHFSHTSNSNCDSEHINQTALHILAKEIIEEVKFIKFPPLSIAFIQTDTYKKLSANDKYRFEKEFDTPFTLISETYVTFDQIILEKRLSSIIPDIIGIANGKECLIEIAVSHFVDEEKKAKVQKLNLPMIEIDLSFYSDSSLNRRNLRNLIIEDVSTKKWIFNPKLSRESYKAEEYFSTQIKEVFAAEKAEFEIKKQKYKQEITAKRNDDAFFEYYKQSGLYEKFPSLPFFLDIPIEGELAINHDRRLWQSAVFESLLLTQSEVRYLDFRNIDKYVFDNFETNCKTDYSGVLSCFLKHLDMLGFIEYYDDPLVIPYSYSYIHIKIPRNIIPPNQKYANKLKNIICNSDPCSLETAQKINNLYNEFSQ